MFCRINCSLSRPWQTWGTGSAGFRLKKKKKKPLLLNYWWKWWKRGRPAAVEINSGVRSSPAVWGWVLWRSSSCNEKSLFVLNSLTGRCATVISGVVRGAARHIYTARCPGPENPQCLCQPDNHSQDGYSQRQSSEQQGCRSAIYLLMYVKISTFGAGNLHVKFMQKWVYMHQWSLVWGPHPFSHSGFDWVCNAT